MFPPLSAIYAIPCSSLTFRHDNLNVEALFSRYQIIAYVLKFFDDRG